MLDAARIATAVLLFAGAWAGIHVGFYEREQIVDTPVYEEYGEAITRGEVPYRDFEVEYPPLALPVFVVPALGDGDYRSRFELLMALCGAGLVVGVGLAARRLGLGLPTLAFVALSPFAIGSVILTRFDLWPAMLGAFALAALLHDRFRLGHGLLGLAVAAKLYPGVLLPLALAFAWRRRGRREALVCAGAFAAVVLAAYLPFVLVGAEGVAASLGRQLSRPLQVESLGAALLLVGHDLVGTDVEIASSHGSQNVRGTAAAALAVVLTIAQVAVLAWLWLRFARARRPGPGALAAAAAAAATAFVALGKVVSPQFLIWLVPLVPLAASVFATALLGAALVLTQLWFPFRYWDLVRELDTSVAWLVLARDLVLLALLLVLARRAATLLDRDADGLAAERAPVRTALD